MKLRIKGDSLRFRLTQSEVQQLGEQSAVEDRVQFGGGAALVYRLRPDNAAAAIGASFANGVVEVRVPAQGARDWSRSQEVALSSHLPKDEPAGPRILVEKDFACLTVREGEDESDNFANPNATC